MAQEELIGKVVDAITPKLWKGAAPDLVKADIKEAAEAVIPIIATAAEAERERIIKIIQEEYIPGRDRSQLVKDIRK